MSSAQHAPVGRPYSRPKRSESSPLLAVTSLFLGILVAVLGFAALFMWIDAHNARDTANRASDKVAAADSPSATSDVHAHATAAGLESYAGAAPANAAALAAAHRPFPAVLPAAPAGPVANVDLVLKDVTVEIAPGVKYSAWAWAGGAPGPVIHVRQGQLVKITLTNKGAIPHSVDFHAARIAPNVAFGDVFPGKSVSYTFRATDPGVFMYHCGTKPVLMHIANGMYGAIVVEPAPGVLPKADKNYVLVASEWYPEGPPSPRRAPYRGDRPGRPERRVRQTSPPRPASRSSPIRRRRSPRGSPGRASRRAAHDRCSRARRS